MAATQASRMAFIAAVRSATGDLLTAIDQLNVLLARWNAGMNIWLINPTEEGDNVSYGDFAAAIGITSEELAAVLGTTLTALNTLLEAGHRTNLEKVRP